MFKPRLPVQLQRGLLRLRETFRLAAGHADGRAPGVDGCRSRGCRYRARPGHVGKARALEAVPADGVRVVEGSLLMEATRPGVFGNF